MMVTILFMLLISCAYADFAQLQASFNKIRAKQDKQIAQARLIKNELWGDDYLQFLEVASEDEEVFPNRTGDHITGLVLNSDFLESLRVVGVEAGTHYGDPSADGGCESDEVSVQISGIKGDFCTSKCSLFKTCPTDVPAGVAAKPTCALSDASSGSKYCALICDPSVANTCGMATCKPISGTGICTYND